MYVCVGGLSVCMYGVCGGCGVYMWFCVCVCVCGSVCGDVCVVCVWFSMWCVCGDSKWWLAEEEDPLKGWPSNAG